MFPSILIVDDEAYIRKTLKDILNDEGFEVSIASNGYEALKSIEKNQPDLTLLDIWMPGIDGIETLKEIKKIAPEMPVVMITGHGTIDTAVSATKYGAYDFIEKPLSIDKVVITINNALNFRRIEEENKYLKRKSLEKNSISGRSQAVNELRINIAKAAPSDSSILIRGENGTGKELIARTIHQLSTRADHALVTVNCAAIPEEMIETELFGYERGAFPGAKNRYKGKLELATSGTLFLDEVGDMSLKTQGKILRVLEDKKFQRIGGNREIDADFRIIASTNKNMEAEIASGNFREDLYYRLNVVPIEVPALRDRKEDITGLAEIFLQKASEACNKPKIQFTDEALSLLSGYSWPGNVRELKNLVERLTIMSSENVIDSCDIPAPYNGQKAVDASNDFPVHTDTGGSLSDAVCRFEADLAAQRLAAFGGDMASAAASLGITEERLSGLVETGLKEKI